MSAPFDSLAATYDRDFTDTLIGRYLRSRVHERLLGYFRPGERILEMGCGTGEDALFLAQRGIRVTATDASDAMLDAARAKTQGIAGVTLEKLDLRDIAAASGQIEHFNGAFSNFGAFNCLDNWQPIAQWLAERIVPGGKVCLGIMSPFYLWEMVWHGLHLEFKIALRRLRSSTFRPHVEAVPIRITYPTIGRITRDFAPFFKRIRVFPLGIFLPPSDVYGVIEKHPRLLKMLLALEERFGKIPRLALFADHYWIELERTESNP